MSDCVFCKIVNGEIPATIYLETDNVLAIKNINPEAPFHALIIPKQHLKLDDLEEESKTILGELLLMAPRLAENEGIINGFRLVINNGPDSGQEVEHLHVHFLAGKKLGKILCD